MNEHLLFDSACCFRLVCAEFLQCKELLLYCETWATKTAQKCKIFTIFLLFEIQVSKHCNL